MLSLTERVRTLIRAQGEIPVCIENALLDIASEVEANREEVRTLALGYLSHLTECPHIEPPAARPTPMQVLDLIEHAS